MSEGATGLEPTIHITEADYPEIMRIVASDGEVDAYLASAGVAGDVFGDGDGGTELCVPERAALGGSLLYVVEVGEVAADHLERKVVVALHRQDETQSLDILGRELAVAGLRP